MKTSSLLRKEKKLDRRYEMKRCLAILLGLGVFMIGLQCVWAEEEETKFDEIVVTATKTEIPLKDLPVTVHVVDKKSIESQPETYISNFGELIRDLPGVHVGQYFPWGPPWINLRGTGYFIGRTGYLVDGVPVTPFLSTPIHHHDIERIEVLLGPSSALYGANAMGGTVNLITKRGTKETGAKVDLGYGSRDTWRPHVEIGNQIGNFHVYASYSGDYSDGYKMNPFEVVWELYQYGQRGWLSYASLEENKHRYSYYNIKLGWENEKKAGIWVGYHRQDAFLYGGRPNRTWLDDAVEGLGTLRFHTPIGELMKVTGTLGFQHLERPTLNNMGPTFPGGVLTWDSTPTTKEIWKQKRSPVELQTDFYLGKQNILTVGGLWLREDELRETKSRITGATSAKTEYTTDQTAFYLQDQVFFFDGKLNILAGIRYDHWKYHDIFDLVSIPQKRDEIKRDHLTYRGGIKYSLTDSVTIRASGGTGFWPGLPIWMFTSIPTGSTRRVPNPDLKPEKTWMVDMGLDVHLKKWGTSFTLTPYYGRISDLITYIYSPHPTLPGVNIVKAYNLGGVKIYGLEMGLEQKLLQPLTAFASLTLNHSEITQSGEATGIELSNSPDYFGSIGFIYRHPEIINGRISMRFSDKRYYVNDVATRHLPYYSMKAYEVVDAKIWREWKVWKGILTTAISVDNLFNKKYETEFIWIHPGRSLQLNVGYKYLF